MVAKSPVRQKCYVFATNIVNHERIWRIITGHTKNMKRTLTNIIHFLYLRSIRPGVTGPLSDIYTGQMNENNVHLLMKINYYYIGQ